VKLLRVLQEREVVRLGARASIPIGGGLEVSPEIEDRLAHRVADFVTSLRRHDAPAA
jgi:hypothetical protein